ncbi:MAG: hypothetical protein UT85_C0043G0006 [Candidatus Levybacteria bacterium GW2011_GWA2_40_16]|nr:MAG: hypothetical protein UT85_C0043G0006 [Candidatus Levybacteria bacterium GW2011_GWA2_40_16]
MSTAADGIVESAGKSFPGGFKTPEAAFANTQTNKLVPAPAITETAVKPTTPENTQQAENPSELLREKLLAEQAKLEADRTAAQPIIPTREELAKKVSPEAQKILDYWKKP